MPFADSDRMLLAWSGRQPRGGTLVCDPRDPVTEFRFLSRSKLVPERKPEKTSKTIQLQQLKNSIHQIP